MTILFFTSEDMDMILTGGSTMTDTTSLFDSAYVRSGAVINVNTYQCLVNFDSSSDNMYISYRLFHSAPISSGTDQPAFRLFQGANEVFRIHPSNGVWHVYTFDGGAQLRDTFSDQPAVGILQQWTIQFHLAVSGSFTVWLNDKQVASFAGDTVGDTGATAVDAAAWEGTNNSSVTQVVSEIVAATEHTINMRVVALVPSAEGNQTQWTNGFGNIDEFAIDTADKIFTDTAAQVEMMNLSNYGGNTDLTDVKALAASVNAKRGATGPQNLQMGFRENVTEVFSANQALTEVFSSFRVRQDTNPDTSAAWTLAELDSMQAGVKSIT